MDIKKIISLITPLTEEFDIHLSKPLLQIWVNALSKFSEQEVQNGVEKVFMTHTYGKPKLAHLVEAIQGKPQEVTREMEDIATVAVANIDRLVRRKSNYECLTLEMVDGDKRFLAALNDAGGWARMCSARNEYDFNDAKKAFKQSYIARYNDPEDNLPILSHGIVAKQSKKSEGAQTLNQLLQKVKK